MTVILNQIWVPIRGIFLDSDFSLINNMFDFFILA